MNADKFSRTANTAADYKVVGSNYAGNPSHNVIYGVYSEGCLWLQSMRRGC